MSLTPIPPLGAAPRSPALPRVHHGAGSISRWIERQLPSLRRDVQSDGAVLLRGFALDDPEELSRAAAIFAGPLGESYEGPSPRRALAPGVYTASDVWSALVVAEHAEMSYLPRMPRHLFFWCRQPASRGGATTLVDGRRVLARLDASRIAPLLAAPVRVRRRHARPDGWHDPFELKRWPGVFGTRDRAQAEQRARALGYSVQWDKHGALTLEQSQPLVRHHPVTGEAAWLNHLLVFHASALTATLADARRSEPRAALPHPLALAYRALTRLGHASATDVCLADGTPIDDALVEHVRAAVAAETFAVRWQRGDLLIVDNHLCMHGRRPFRGAREVIVAWSDARA